MYRLPVKLICYRDICGENYMRIALAEKANDVAMELMLNSYVDINVLFEGTDHELMHFIGIEQ